MIQAKDGSIYDRALVDPDRNNWGPRLGFAYTHDAENGASRRLGRQLRALQPRRRRKHPCHQQPAGHQRRRRAGKRARADVQNDAGRVSGGIYRPVEIRSRSSRTSPTCRGTTIRHPCKAGICRCSARSAPNMIARRCVRRQSRRRHAALRQLQPGRAEQRGGHTDAAAAAPHSGLGRHHLRVQRRQVAIQGADGEIRVAPARRCVGAELDDVLRSERQRRGHARESERQRTVAAGFPKYRRGLRPFELSPALQQHDELRVVAASRVAASAGWATRPARSTCSSADGSSRESAQSTPASR